MSRLIDAEALIADVERLASLPWGDERGNEIEFSMNAEEMIRFIDHAPNARPTVDKDYLIRLIQYAVYDSEDCRRLIDMVDRPTGHWYLKENIYGVAYCSLCDYELHTDNTNFCPACGADMRGGGL